ncbi:DnaJ C-terminal domain-containing protein [Dactylosporangium sp. CA-139066]|uniref:DnaJ C-terminal domain-containing protein n=1 Tax=Dactylosporangium sp. CA-139066 TaxID=3239930 RepID=UPI003D92605F
MAVDFRDPYEVLGVARGAGRDEIQRAYRRLARRHHPDVSAEPGAEERFKEITAAYRVLADPRRRREYDATRRRDNDASRRPGDDASRRREYDGTWRRDVDLTGGLFRGVRGADTRGDLTIGVETVYTGGRHRVTLPGPAGRPRQYDVAVPPGVVDGEKLRLPGQGAPGAQGGPPGDLFLVVRLAPHPRFKVSGRDVMVEVPVSPWEAALGAVVPVGMPAGDLRLDVPPGSSSGRRLRLRGAGLPNARGPAGDLFAEVRIVVPERLTPGEHALYRSLARESPFDARLT